MASPSAFSTKLKLLRTAAALSQAQLARRAEMSENAIFLLEKGEREPTWTTVQKLARALGVSVAEFADELPGVEPTPPGESEPAAPPPLPRAVGKRK